MNDSTVSIFTDEFTESGVTFVRTFLQLCGVTVDNQGLYSCVAENSLNYTSSSFYLNILGQFSCNFTQWVDTHTSTFSVSSVVISTSLHKYTLFRGKNSEVLKKWVGGGN